MLPYFVDSLSFGGFSAVAFDYRNAALCDAASQAFGKTDVRSLCAVQALQRLRTPRCNLASLADVSKFCFTRGTEIAIVFLWCAASPSTERALVHYEGHRHLQIVKKKHFFQTDKTRKPDLTPETLPHPLKTRPHP